MGLAVAACAPKAEEAATEGEAAPESAKVEMPKAPTKADLTPSKKQIDSVSYLIGINFGSFIKGYDFGEVNFAQIEKGIKDFQKAKGSPRDPDFGEQFKINPEKMNNMFNDFLDKRHKLVALTNKEEGEKFLAANAGKSGVVTTESGLQYKIIEQGNDKMATSSKDTVWVKYCGKLLDGTVFDETKEDQSAVQLSLNRVIKGWSEGLQLVGEGGHIELYIPSNLAYGEQGSQAIAPNSTLIFDVLVEKVGIFVPKPVEEPAPAKKK